MLIEATTVSPSTAIHKLKQLMKTLQNQPTQAAAINLRLLRSLAKRVLLWTIALSAAVMPGARAWQ